MLAPRRHMRRIRSARGQTFEVDGVKVKIHRTGGVLVAKRVVTYEHHRADCPMLSELTR
jgi:hypothetical protein